MTTLLDMPDGVLIPYPPINGMFFICKDLRQCCCPTTAANYAEIHTVDYQI